MTNSDWNILMVLLTIWSFASGYLTKKYIDIAEVVWAAVIVWIPLTLLVFAILAQALANG